MAVLLRPEDELHSGDVLREHAVRSHNRREVQTVETASWVKVHGAPRQGDEGRGISHGRNLESLQADGVTARIIPGRIDLNTQ